LTTLELDRTASIFSLQFTAHAHNRVNMDFSVPEIHMVLALRPFARHRA